MNNEYTNMKLLSFSFGIAITVPEDWTEEQCQKYKLK